MAHVPSVPADPSVAGLMTVLIAEDEPLILVLRREQVTDCGFRVRTARDGAEALVLVEREPPALVVADVEMPHLDGLALCRALRDGAGTCRIPNLLVSGRARRWRPVGRLR